MNAVSTVPNDATAPAAEQHGVPQLRTILLTDLVDSTALVERLGDGAAAELFRAHDRLVLRLQNDWRGRLIDRSDGLLLLFERPVDGLGFALDYARGLRELGAPHDTDIKARAGMHVGEVLSWRNSDEAVRVGAKPVEVEGLAKPMAGRLMTMARPGQLLMSAVAEPLAHRAARELGERGQHLVWKSHGRWRFKGVPEPQQIFEVGEPGITPLRAPQPSPKAWRDIPLWRRPAALATELVLLAALGLGIWFITKPQPAIAFNERDWVVLADLRNLTDQPLLDDSLEQAFRISLEQSRHVNVLSDLKTRDTLARMQRAPGTELDRATASEIAIRDGARAVILPTVAEVGGRVRVSAEVIDPNSQTTVYAEYADGKGAVSALASIDEVTAALREKLGESLEAVEQDSQPLPEVTTSDLDALRSYALGQQAFSQGQYRDALGFYEHAVALDPEFALAYLGMVRAHAGMADLKGGLSALRQALSLRDRLPPREQFYLDAWNAQVNAAPTIALKEWRKMAELYPDFYPAIANVGNNLFHLNRFEEAIPYASRATSPQNAFDSLSWDLLGKLQLALNDYPEAWKAFENARAHGVAGANVRLANTSAAQRQFTAADNRWRKMPELEVTYSDRVTILIDSGRWSQAVDAAKPLSLQASDNSFRSRAVLLPLATAHWIEGDNDAASAVIDSIIGQSMTALKDPVSRTHATDDLYLVISAGLLAQRIPGNTAAAELLQRLKKQKAVIGTSPVRELHMTLMASKLVAEGKPELAIERLSFDQQSVEPFQAHSVRLDAYAATGAYREALVESAWLGQHRGHAYAEQGCGWCQQPLSVLDTTLAQLRAAEVLVKTEKKADAREHLERFEQAWPPESLPRHLRVRRDAVIEAFN